MKKVLIFIFLLVFMCGCSNTPKAQESSFKSNGLWVTYYELNSMLESESGFKSEFGELLKNCNDLKIQNLYVHTRAFGRTIYPSKIFPQTAESKRYDYDILEYIVTACKSKNIGVFAWINPYRLSRVDDVDKADFDSLEYLYLKDADKSNDSTISFCDGYYLNPASNIARALVLDEIRELLEKYELCGVHFDDYFYPTTRTEFDSLSYKAYIKNAANPTIPTDWRRENVNMLISSCYSTVKYFNENMIFSISPAADIIHNYDALYADVELWIKSGWMDEIIPQLYFGFEYPDEKFRFPYLLERWKEAVKTNDNIDLKIGLGCYKAMPELEADKAEWGKRNNIIAKQTDLCEQDDVVDGRVYFSYSSLFGEKKSYKLQLEKILEYYNTGEYK